VNDACRRAVDRFAGALDGPPGASDAAFLEKHLDDCGPCREETERLAALHRDLARLAVDPRRDRVTALLARVRWEEASLSRRRRRHHSPAPSERRGFVAAIVAAAFVAAVLAAFLSHGGRPARDTPLAAPEPPPNESEVVREPAPPEPRRIPREERRPAIESPMRIPVAPEVVRTPPSPPVQAPVPAPVATIPESRTSIIAAAAKVEAVSGAASADGNAIEPGSAVFPGQVFSTTGGALLSMPDATRVYLGPDTEIRLGGAKTVDLVRGDLAADVTPQPKEDPRAFSTPLADVRVLGTWLTVSARPASTVVEVEKGRVQVRRRRDGWSLDVREGQFATVSEGQAPRVRALPTNLLADPGFESEGKAWTGVYHPDGTTFGGLSVQSKSVRSGTRALEFLTSDLTGRDREAYQDFRVAPGDGIGVEGWVRTEKLGSKGVGVWLVWLRSPDSTAETTAVLRAKGMVLRQDLLASFSGTSDWTRVAHRLTAPAQARQVRLFLYTDADDPVPGAAWFDDFRLRRFTK